MECSEKKAFGLLGTLIFSGWTVAAFFIPRLSDLYGRKWVFIGSMLTQLLALVAMLAAKSYTVMAVALFVIGMCSASRWTVSYVYLMEFLTDAKIKIIGPLVNASAAIAFLVGAFTLQFLTKNTIVLEYAAVGISIYSSIFCGLFLPESAKWLVNSGQMEKAAQSYSYIAEVNGQTEAAQQVYSCKF